MLRVPRDPEDNCLAGIWDACRPHIAPGNPDPLLVSLVPPFPEYSQGLSVKTSQILTGLALWYADYIIRHAAPCRWVIGSTKRAFTNFPCVQLIEDSKDRLNEAFVFSVTCVSAHRHLSSDPDDGLRSHFKFITGRATPPHPMVAERYPHLFIPRKLS